MEKICSHCGKSFTAVREIKKYCSDSCRQLAFYKRSSDISGTEIEEQEHLFSLTKFDNEENIGNEASIENETSTFNNLKKVIHKAEEKYEPIISNFIEELLSKTEDTETYSKFQQPKNHWTTYEFENIKWVSVRLRCLLENVLRLGNERIISRGTFKALRDSFMSIIETTQFKHLPNNYPFTALIITTQKKFENIVNTLPKKCSTSLMIKRNRKIELLAARFLLSIIVPRKKYADLWDNEY